MSSVNQYPEGAKQYMDMKLFEALFCIGKSYKPSSQRESVLCFYEALVYLLPTYEHAKIFSTFIHYHPLEHAIKDSTSLFEWTYKLYYTYMSIIYRGIPGCILSFNESVSRYSRITKDLWGISYWVMMHYLAANAVGRQVPLAFKAFITCLRDLIPCDECKVHMKAYIETHPYEPQLFIWTWKFHNDVNKRLRKHSIPLKDALKLYTI